jgi:osmotically inducible lipoprotein OsmB
MCAIRQTAEKFRRNLHDTNQMSATFAVPKG